MPRFDHVTTDFLDDTLAIAQLIHRELEQSLVHGLDCLRRFQPFRLFRAVVLVFVLHDDRRRLRLANDEPGDAEGRSAQQHGSLLNPAPTSLCRSSWRCALLSSGC